ncbi:MAG TPA: homocysteine S-methyltransferase family protein [Bacteroidaceae bacterium]|nr:homocysteine S-methyltransferase family protein [Bacteroidaceae bacterium]
MLRKKNRTIEIFDGAYGTELSKLPQAQDRLVEELNITDPEVVIKLHRDYIDSGADYITTNTLSVNPAKWECDTLSWDKVALAAIENVQKATEGTKVKVFFNISSSGKLMEPIGDFTFQSAYNNFKQVVDITKDSVDGYLLETFTDLYEIKAAILAIKENCQLPIFATMTFDESGLTLTGSSPEIAALTLTSLGVDVIGANCSTSPQYFVEIVRRMKKHTHLPILIQPNKGLPLMNHGNISYNFTDKEFSEWIEQIIRAGAWIVGGCCGTTPSTIRYISKFKELIPVPLQINQGTYICSATKLLRLEKGVICGERLNPTGNKKLKEALLESNYDYLQREALIQEEAGADFLDLNTGVANSDEKELLCQATKKIQEICDLPLQLDSSNVDALEAAIRIYNGVPLINSINGDDDSLNSMLPILAKYGTPAISLTLNENGIPNNSKERLEIAKKIIRKAGEYNIPCNKLIFDALVMTISSNQDHGNVTLQSLKELKKIGVLTTIGLSNISFGLPDRSLLNSTFLAMALTSGLDIPILNPLDKKAMNVLRAYRALSGIDTNCEKYISFNTNNNQEKVGDNLYSSVVWGLKDSIKMNLQEELSKNSKEKIIDSILIPALNYVGVKFENKELFLPQLIKSAEAAKLAFDTLSDIIVQTKADSDNSQDKPKGSIILATVRGDVHDIGKNIVKVLLQSHGFQVIDLGKNVSKAKIAEKYLQHTPSAIGLSALMTTSVQSMTDTIHYLKTKEISCPIIVGGAILTADISLAIGAQYYAKNALEAVDTMNKICNNKK